MGMYDQQVFAAFLRYMLVTCAAAWLRISATLGPARALQFFAAWSDPAAPPDTNLLDRPEFAELAADAQLVNWLAALADPAITMPTPKGKVM